MSWLHSEKSESPITTGEFRKGDDLSFDFIACLEMSILGNNMDAISTIFNKFQQLRQLFIKSPSLPNTLEQLNENFITQV